MYTGERSGVTRREESHVSASRAEASQEKTSVDVLVCHGNVIRYFVCRALQFDPQGWLRMAVHNGESSAPWSL